MAAAPVGVAENLVPDKEISVKGQGEPAWKITWDEARRLSAAGSHAEAIERYEALLAVKPGVEEAKWELARLLIHGEQWDRAAALLELLLEKGPTRVDYLLALARVMRETGSIARAVDLFGQVHELDRTNRTAMLGMIRGLLALDRSEKALPLLEAMYRLEPDNREVVRFLGLLDFKMGRYERARLLLTASAAAPEADREVLGAAARVLDHLGLANEAAPYWRRVLALEPDHDEALNRLADIDEAAGRYEQAVRRLLVLLEHHPEDGRLLGRLGDLYLHLNQPDQALPLYRRYLRLDPRDSQRWRAVVRIHLEGGDRGRGLAALEDFLATRSGVEPGDLRLAARLHDEAGDRGRALKALEDLLAAGDGTEPDDLRQAVRLYDQAGQYGKAIPLYRRLVDLSPGDPQVLAALVRDLLAIGADEEALDHGRRLAEIAPDRLAVYRSMAEMLERMGRERELLELLAVILELAPGDRGVMFKLAGLYEADGGLAEALTLYEQLTASSPGDPAGWLGRGDVLLQLGRPVEALNAYETLLRLDPAREEIRIRCARLAGDLGEIERWRGHLTFLTAPLAEATDGAGLELRFHVAATLATHGFLDEAVEDYRAILRDLSRQATADFPVDRENPRCRAWIAMAAAFQDEGLVFEAEQHLRQGLQSEESCRSTMLAAMVEFFIAEGRADEAETVIEAHAGEPEVGEAGDYRPADLWRLQLLGIRERYRPAIRLGRSLLARGEDGPLPRTENDAAPEESTYCRLGLLMSRFYLEDDDPLQARRLLRQLDDRGCRPPEAAVLLDMVRQRLKEPAGGAAIFETAGATRLLELAAWYREYRQWDRVAAAAGRALLLVPDSLTPGLLTAEALEQSGRLHAALNEYEKIVARYPANNRARVATARLLFRTGRLEPALAGCDAILATGPERGDIVLLKARILWAMGRWIEAMDLHALYLAPPVGDVLHHELERRNLMPRLTPRKTFWNRLTFTEGTVPEAAAVVMSLSHAVSRAAPDRQRNGLVVPYYARYRWSGRVAGELAARRAVRQREYHHAAGLYEQLLEGNKADESLLFDLAGIYNRLERTLFESATYETLRQLNPDFPGLAEVVERNRLKRRPRTTIDYGMREDDGWDDYKARRKEWLRASIRMAPRPRHEWEIDAGRIRYQSTAGGAPFSEAALWSNRTSLSYRKSLAPGLSVDLGGGMEDVENGLARTTLLHCNVLGKIGDRLSGTFAYRRDVIDDTIASLTRNIVGNDVRAGMTLDIMSRLRVGGHLAHVDYSDDNRKNSYTLWSSYLLFPEPLHLSLGYQYDFDNALKANTPGGVPEADGFSLADRPYLSLQNYWLSTFSAYFRHQLDGDTLDRGTPKYYSLRYSLGYDSRGADLQEFEAGLFMELTGHLIAAASGMASNLQSYQSKEVWLSLTYRW